MGESFIKWRHIVWTVRFRILHTCILSKNFRKKWLIFINFCVLQNHLRQAFISRWLYIYISPSWSQMTDKKSPSGLVSCDGFKRYHSVLGPAGSWLSQASICRREGRSLSGMPRATFMDGKHAKTNLTKGGGGEPSALLGVRWLEVVVEPVDVRWNPGGRAASLPGCVHTSSKLGGASVVKSGNSLACSKIFWLIFKMCCSC